MKKLILTLLVTCSVTIMALAQRTISGNITNEQGLPIAEVSISIKNTKLGTMSDKEGNYSIKAPANAKTITYSCVGMLPQEIEIKNKTTINVQLASAASVLEDVVVIGYGTVRKKDLTGSVSVVKAKEIEQSQTTEWLQALQGRTAGVNITSESGEPGSGINIQVRGANSIIGNSSPLFVIDGVQMDLNNNDVAKTNSTQATMNPLSMINPVDIESIEVLKDASATAIYGSRGANGVVIITTKGGKSGRSVVEFNSSIGFSKAASKINVLEPQEYLTYAALRGGNDPFLRVDTNGNGTLDAPRDFSKVKSYNWQDEALRTALTNNHNLTVSGGNEKTNYAAGLSYIKQEGLVKYNDYNRYNFRVRVDHKATEKLKFGFNINAAFSNINGAANNGGPESYNGLTQALVVARPWVLTSETTDVSLIDPTSNEYISPLDLIKNAFKQTRMMRLLGNFKLDYKFSKSLSYSGIIAGNYASSKLQEFYSNETSWGNFYNGLAGVAHAETYSFNHSSQLNFTKTVKDHNINVLAGFEVFSNNWENFTNRVANFADQSTGVNDLRKGASLLEYSTNKWKNNRLSYLSRVNYSYKDKYLFTASLRADGSDKFGPGNRWGYFPSAAFAWKMSNENFMKNSSLIKDLKLRVSYGKTGNEGIPPYTYFGSLQNTYVASNNSVSFGLSPGSLPNPNLKWETTSQYNAGLDFSILKNSVNITVDYYLKETRDMLLDAPVSAQSGFFRQWLNIGGIDNSGIELSVSSININKKDFKWESSFNISFNNNIVQNIGGAQFIPVTIGGSWIQNAGRVIVGQQIGTMYGYQFAGIYQLADFTWQNGSDPTIPAASRVYALKSGNPVFVSGTAVPGALKYADMSGPAGKPDGQIDDQYDRSVIGNSNPKHFGGLNNTFTYKNFDLNIFFQWSYGNDIFNEAKLREQGYQPHFNVTETYYKNYWSETNPSNTHPGLGQISISPSSYFVEDGSFLRLKTLGFGYNLSKKLLKKTGLSALRFNITATNLITWTKYTGLDPEVNSNNPLLRGLDRFAYPRPRTIAIGVSVKF
jgi:TonB-dependent starch-binding outer membrane protein SusC